MDESYRNAEGDHSNLKIYRIFMLGLLFFSLYLAYLILRPFFHTIILSVVLASIFYPLKPRLLQFYKGRENAVAFTSVVVITFLIILPVMFFLSALVSQGVETIDRINNWISQGKLEDLLQNRTILFYSEWFRERFGLGDVLKGDFQAALLSMSQRIGQFLFSRIAGLLKDMADVIFNFFVMIFITYYIVRDGERMLASVKHLSPLREDQEDRIIARIKAVARSVLLGSFLTAVCQGLIGGIGLAIVGIPALFWGTLIGLASFIPVVGTAVIWVPAVLYLALAGRWTSAIFLALWSIVLVGSIDNFLRPFLMRGEGSMSTFYVFLAIIGGIKLFGLIGLLYGPLILGFATVMLYIYQVEYREMLATSAVSPDRQRG